MLAPLVELLHFSHSHCLLVNLERTRLGSKPSFCLTNFPISRFYLDVSGNRFILSILGSTHSPWLAHYCSIHEKAAAAVKRSRFRLCVAHGPKWAQDTRTHSQQVCTLCMFTTTRCSSGEDTHMSDRTRKQTGALRCVQIPTQWHQGTRGSYQMHIRANRDTLACVRALYQDYALDVGECGISGWGRLPWQLPLHHLQNTGITAPYISGAGVSSVCLLLSTQSFMGIILGLDPPTTFSGAGDQPQTHGCVDDPLFLLVHMCLSI